MERFSSPLPLEFKSAGAEGLVEGYASTWHNVDSYGDVMMPGAFTKSLADRWPVALWSHNPAEVVGKWVECVEDGRGLRVKGQLNLATRRGRECYAHLKDGDVGGLSIGYSVARNGSELAPDGRTTRLKEVCLFEVSVVAVAANREARVERVKSGLHTRDEVEAALAQLFPGRMAKKLLSGGWPALSGEDEDDPEIQQFAARLKRATARLKGL